MSLIAKQYKIFPIYSSWTQLINSLSATIIIFFLNFLFTPAVVGLYQFGASILQQPITLISNSVGKVFYQKAARQYSNNQNIYNGLKKSTFGLFLIGIVPFSIIAIFGSELFSFIFGEQWTESGKYLQILSPWFLFLFINRPSMAVFRIYKKNARLLTYVVILIIFRALGIYFGYIFYGEPKASLILFSIVGVIFNIYLILQAFYWAKRQQQYT